MSAVGVKHVTKKLINIFISEDIDNMPLESRVVYIWVIDQVFGQDGCILAKFFFFACLWTETKSRSKNSQKKNEANIQPP